MSLSKSMKSGIVASKLPPTVAPTLQSVSAQSLDQEYLDLYAINANNINTLPVPISFTQTRNLPFIDCPEDYNLSVIRFQVDSQILPVFAAAIKYNSSLLNDTIYSVSLSWTNPLNLAQTFNAQQYVQWISQDKASPIPNAPSTTSNGFQDNSSGYYYAYNYSYVIQLCNNALSTCFTTLNGLVVAAGLVLPTTHAPVLTWNVDKNIAVLNSDILGYNQSVANKITIYFNQSMYQLFNSIPAYLMSYTSPIGQDYRVDTNSFGASTVTAFPFYLPTYNAIQTFQEQTSVSIWSPISSIVFTTNTLPINATQVCNPCIFINSIPSGNNGTNAGIANVISDFQSSDNIYKNNILYIPSGQYRYVDLIGKKPLYTIDIQVAWIDKFGNSIPFRLVSGSCASVKILFERKKK